MLILDTTAILSALENAGVDTIGANITFGDASYAAIAEGFLRGKFSDDLRETISKQFGHYKANVRDCNHFARYVAAIAQLWNSDSANEGHALAFGEFWFTTRSRGRHAINVAVVNGGHVVFYEPQTQEVVKLLAEEIASADTIRF